MMILRKRGNSRSIGSKQFSVTLIPILCFYTLCLANVSGFLSPLVPLKSTCVLSLSGVDDDAFMKSLDSRARQLRMNEKDKDNPSLAIVLVPGCILPRQVVTVKVQSADFLSDIIRQTAVDVPRFGMVGRRVASSDDDEEQDDILPVGVEVEILSATVLEEEMIKSTAIDNSLVELKVRGLRIFNVDVDDLQDCGGGWMHACVRYRNEFSILEKAESDPFKVALAMQQAQELTSPNNSMKESKSLVEMWLVLARARNVSVSERIDDLLEEIGEMPSWEEPSECAFWVAALINPTPSIDLAVDIRMGLILSNTALERTQLVLNALWNSIQRLDASTAKYIQIKE